MSELGQLVLGFVAAWFLLPLLAVVLLAAWDWWRRPARVDRSTPFTPDHSEDA